MYVFNYEDNQGYAVVSANKSTEALIAVTEQGNYNEETTTDNPGLALYMDMAKNYVARGGILPPGSSIGGGGLPLTEIRTVTTRDTLAYINPLLEVRWGGGYPYNFYHTEDSGEGGHEDRTETGFRRNHRRLRNAVSPLAHEDRIVDEHDTVLHHDTHEDQDTYQTHRAKRRTCNPQTEKHSYESERNGEHDHERTNEGFELRSHHDIHEDDDHHEKHDEVSEHFLLVLI